MIPAMDVANRAPATCMIEVGGEALSGTIQGGMRDVTVTMSRGAATTAVLRFDSVRTETGDWTVQDAGVFVPWRRIAITARFGTHTEEVMRGFIKDVEAEYPADMGASSVMVTAQDETLVLDREHLRKAWAGGDRQVSDGQVVRELAGEAFDRIDAEDGLTHTSLNQDGTAAAFLRTRAEANGYELYARGSVLHFHAPRLTESSQPTIMVYAGLRTNCERFSVHHDGHRPDRIRVDLAADEGHEAQTMSMRPALELLGARSADSEASGLGPFEWRMGRLHGASRAEIESRARATAARNAWKIVARGELDGTLYGHVLLSHHTVEVDGVGSTHGGRYYVDEVEHLFSSTGYRQRFRLLRNATGRGAP